MRHNTYAPGPKRVTFLEITNLIHLTAADSVPVADT